MKILFEAESMLRNAGYATRRSSTPEGVVEFENVNVLGMIAEFTSPSSLIAGWTETQNTFLRSRASFWQRDPDKAWNVYAVFLTTVAANANEQGELLAIEEDFSATRKIAASGILTRAGLARSLSPLLPLTLLAAAPFEDPKKILATRLTQSENTLLALVQKERSHTEQVISWLVEQVL